MPISNGKYINPGWVNGQPPAINASELNAISDTLESLDAAGGSVSVRSPFIVVGTTQNGATTETCDFLCDGTADDVEINAAIAQSSQTGQEVYILGGTYNLTKTIQSPSGKPMTISGAGPSKTTLRGNGVSPLIDGYKITIKNISLGGYSGGSTSNILVEVSNSCIFENVYFYDFGQYAIYDENGGTNASVFAINCSFLGVGADACIYIGSSSGSHICNCNITGNVYISGLGTIISNVSCDGASTITLNNADKSLLSNCILDANVQLTNSSFCSISGNFFTGPYGISLDAQSAYNVVTGNGGGRTQIPSSWTGVTDNGNNNYVANNMPT